MPRQYRRGEKALSYDLRVRISAETAEALEAAAAASFQTRAELARTILENHLSIFQQKRSKKMKYEADYQSAAAALYDGGWRAEDLEDLMTEYDFTKEEATKICEILKEYENK